MGMLWSFLWIPQPLSIRMPKILHFCNQLIKPVLLIPMNPRFVTKKISPLFRGVHFFRGLEAVLNIKILSQNFYHTLIWLIGMGKTCFQIFLSQKLFSEQPYRHTQCMHHIRCSSIAASGNMVKFSAVCASWSSRSVKSSRSEKSSRYNRKRASGARHT